MSGTPELLRLRAAALRLGISVRSLQRLSDRGEGPAMTTIPGLRGRWIRQADLSAWISTLAPETPPPAPAKDSAP